MIKYLLLILLVSCGPDVRIEALKYSCTDTDLVRVTEFVNICKDNGFMKTYCFNRAIVSICSKRDSI